MTISAVTTEQAITRDGRFLHLERHGTGTPTVVFEAGMGASRNSWGAVVPAVAEQTTCVVYDRSGLGRSPRSTGPRPLAQLRDDLLDVLDHVGGGPFVLVGHSWGGPIVRDAAGTRPDAVAGLVLVDQTDEGCDLFFEAGNRRQVAWAPRMLPLMARLGVPARLARKLAQDLPEPWRSAMLAEDGTRASVDEMIAELVPHIEDLERLRREPPALPDVPVTYVSGTQNGFGEKRRRPELLRAHRAAAAALPQGRFVEAPRSSHYVPFTDPEVVVAEIVRILDGAS